MNRILTIALLCLALGLSATAYAQTYDEQGDTGDFPFSAQLVPGGTAAINGTIVEANDTDMYRFDITDPAGFSASTVGGATFDTILFLFDADSTLVLFDDDAADNTFQSTIPAGSVTVAGTYYLALTAFANWGLDAAGSLIFFAGDGPLARWDSTGGETGAYTIALGNVATANEDVQGVPAAFSLGPNYPNPFNPQTTLAYALPEPATVTLTVFDVTGKTIQTLAQGRQAAGWHRTVWDAGQAPSGTYLVRMTAQGTSAAPFTHTRKVILLR